MNKESLKNKLSENHSSFISFIEGLSNDHFLFENKEKWTPGQQLEHIYLSVKPLRQIMSLPKIVFRLMWGTANRKSKSFDELVTKYYQKLEGGGRASGRFIPKEVDIEKGERLKVKLK